MKTFLEYFADKEILSGDGKQSSGLGDQSGSPHDSLDILMRMCKLAMKNHKDELMKFFEELAKQDNLLQQELDDLKRSPNHNQYKKSPEHDMVVPNTADGSAPDF